jgi:hypothetical protein
MIHERDNYVKKNPSRLKNRYFLILEIMISERQIHI